MEKHGTVYTLTGAVKINYQQYTLLADKIVYDQNTGDANAEGHVSLAGGPDDEFITADRGTVNLNQDTARFENVVGSFGGRAPKSTRKLVYTTSNPFIFTGRVVIKKGPFQYSVIGGTMTSCELPQPDWRILASMINVDNGEARAKNGYFKLIGVPVLYLPYVTHPVNTESRQSGLLIPVISNSSTKGIVLGESIYWAFSRSADATFGTEYFSERGWSPSGEIRFRGAGEDFATFHFIALFDRGAPVTNLNQGGQDILFNGRHDYPDGHTSAVVNSEYLSSYVYREAFAETFALAVASEVTSSAFVTHNDNGFSESVHFDRYQNFQGISQVGNGYSTPQIEILHLPSAAFDTVDHRLNGTPLLWGFDGSLAGIKRSEPGFTSGEAGRFDLNPHLALPFHLDGWTFRPEIDVRETFYSESQTPTSSTPIEDASSINRRDFEASFELRPPVLVRDFRYPWLERFLGSDVRHTLEPAITYRYVTGIDNFSSIPRFDAVDVLSNTNEVAYSLTQRLFLRHLHPQAVHQRQSPRGPERNHHGAANLSGMRRRYRRLDHVDSGRKVFLRPLLRRSRLSFAAQCVDDRPRPHGRRLSGWPPPLFPDRLPVEGAHQRAHGSRVGRRLRHQGRPVERKQSLRRLPPRGRLRQHRLFPTPGVESNIYFEPCHPDDKIQSASYSPGIRKSGEAWVECGRGCRLRLC